MEARPEREYFATSNNSRPSLAFHTKYKIWGSKSSLSLT